MLGISELFMPGAQHTEDERQRLDHTRVIEGDHGSGRGPVDLESGQIVVLTQEAVLPPKPRVEEAPEEERATLRR
ncbi:DUF6191 domain-containing protein [Streptomyces sp. N2-109]|uniref:DUF6191 domain-containing protein n=1 Tax=Streptomyces gossypii TaxID=2883101 RepID=A0ABT2JXH8_9ACTN|nr:DUF6191 domain-containing protein [Streptomyces gossypii]MCT2592603.1 DUF6191 domain-containing protein [Streptomyces gossypii]